MSDAKFTQDMPPKGGYKSINFGRIPAKSVISSPGLFIGFTGITVAGMYLYALNYKAVKTDRIEMNDSKIALEPLLMAERQRTYLRQLRKNRDDETKLMKDVPGWVTGTLYGEKLYKTVDDNELVDPVIQEYYAHSTERGLVANIQAHFMN